MNDFDYDSMQKKRIARGAMNKVSHRGCTLPHEHLTKKELKKMNGEVKKYNLTQPMAWAEFRAMPIDLQRKYIKMLQDGYHVSNAMLAEMFGIVPHSVERYFVKNDIPRLSKNEVVKWCRKPEVKAAWKTYCNGVVGGGDSLSQVTPQEVIRNIEETGPKMIEMNFPVNQELMKKSCINLNIPESKVKPLNPTEEPHTLPVDKLDIVYHDIKSLSELKSLICGDITFKNPMEIKIYIREEPKKWYENQIEKEN